MQISDLVIEKKMDEASLKQYYKKEIEPNVKDSFALREIDISSPFNTCYPGRPG
jgi:hypothetical protein